MNNISNDHQKKNGLSLVCNILAGILLLAAIAIFIMTLTSSQSIMNNQIFFQLAGIEALSAIILRPLQSAFVSAGIILASITLIFALILFLAGRVIAKQLSLQERIQLLEEKFS